MGDLTTNFSREEFSCKCGCGFDSIDPQVVTMLQSVRDIYGRGISITSGCRCDAHNAAVGSKPNSAHTKGLAVDVACHSSHLRFLLIQAALMAGFSRIGLHKDFVHIDSSKELAHQVAWWY